jgi:putative ABC transport system permease protein
LRGSIETGLNVLGANSFQFIKYPVLDFSGARRRFANRRDITYLEAARFKELMRGTADVSLQMNRGGRRAKYGDQTTNPNVNLIGSDENFLSSRNYEIAQGRNLGPEDVEFGRPVVVIGTDIVDRLFQNENPLGKSVRIDGQNYIIVGVTASKGSTFGQSQDSNAVTTITKYLATYGQAGRSIGVNVQAPNQAVLAATQDTSVGVMRLVRGLAPEDPNDFEIFSNDSLIETFNNITGMVAVGAFVISAIALVASGVGIMNIMLVSVTERTKEIGVRKSIGARKKNILTQFLIEALALSMVGGLAGVITGIVVGNVIATIMHASVVFPWGWAVGGLTICSIIGITFGFYPAWKAAALDPIEALRYE